MRILAKLVTLLAASLFIFLMPSEAQATPRSWRTSVVYVENDAPGWPVKKAAEDLDNGSSLDLRVVKKCQEWQPCIHVKSKWSIPGDPIGMSVRTRVGERIVHSKVYLENKWGDEATQNERLALVCHELGHSLGLSHSKKLDTCMIFGLSTQTPSHISEEERKKLESWF